MPVPEITLSNGLTMPILGFGTYKVPPGKETFDAVLTALSTGYTSIDTASFYGNEASVGEAVKASGIPRENLFITTKMWNDEHGYDEALAAFARSLNYLKMEYVDLYLIHWPIKEKFIETWRAMEKLYREGTVRAIGVSNFKEHHLDELSANSTETPVINQVELHPLFSQAPLRRYCEERKIVVEAWRPLLKGEVFDESVIQSLSQKHNKTPAQIVLRWEIQHDIVVIPKSVTLSRIEENFDVFDFSLDEDDMERMDGLNRDHRTGPDPDHISD